MFQTAFICIRQFYGHRFITKTRASSIQNGVIWQCCKMQYEKTDMHRNVALPVKQHLLCYVYNKETQHYTQKLWILLMSIYMINNAFNDCLTARIIDKTCPINLHCMRRSAINAASYVVLSSVSNTELYIQNAT